MSAHTTRVLRGAEKFGSKLRCVTTHEVGISSVTCGLGTLLCTLGGCHKVNDCLVSDIGFKAQHGVDILSGICTLSGSLFLLRDHPTYLLPVNLNVV